MNGDPADQLLFFKRCFAPAAKNPRWGFPGEVNQPPIIAPTAWAPA
jgi:hypothetical protein